MKKPAIITLALLGVILPSQKQFLSADEGHHHSDTTEMNQSSEDPHHDHKTIMIQDDQPIPQVDLIVHQDSIKGWNLEIKLDNFAFTPENINQPNQPNQGHAHLYINGEKVTRIYSNWYYLSELPVGNNEVKIGLNTNSHESLMYQDTMIEDSEIVEVN